LLEFAEHLRPEVAAEIGVLCWRDGLLEELFELVVFVEFLVAHFAWTSTPRKLSFFRSIRTARKSLTFTSDSGMPTAWAILACGSSSMSASVATSRYFAGSCWKASLICLRLSLPSAGSPVGGEARLSGRSDSGRACLR